MKRNRLRSLSKQAAVTLLTAARTFPTRATDRGELLGLLQKLHPVRTRHGLIRLGPAGDGGYVLPDDLNGLEACFSPGVGGIIGFERDCAARGMRVFMADGSVESPVQGEAGYTFVRSFIGAVSSSDTITMEEWVGASLPGSGSECLLQIDIEGGEYETFLSMPYALQRRFRVIASEFHSLDQLWSRPFFDLASKAFEKILCTHACVHIHPNNCTPLTRRSGVSIAPVMEFTFLRRDRLGEVEYASQFPHPLDAANEPGPDLVLPECWFRRHGIPKS